MGKKKLKGIICTPPATRKIPQIYKLLEKTTTRGTKSYWVKDPWSPKTKSNSAASSPTKSPLKQKSGPSRMLHEAADFDFDQGDIPQLKLPKSLVSSKASSFLESAFRPVHTGSK